MIDSIIGELIAGAIVGIIVALLGYLRSKTIGGKLKAQGNRLKTIERELAESRKTPQPPPPVNITNTVDSPSKPIARFTGRLHFGYFYFNRANQTVYIPEIYIEYEDGKKELLNIEGFELPKGVGVTEIIGGMTVTLGLPPAGDDQPTNSS